MALNIDGTEGELRVGTKTLAALTAWQKRDKRITFTVGKVNAFLAGIGTPPTEIVLQMTPKVRRIYPIVSVTLDEGLDGQGKASVDLMRARSETTL
jgi:hypothetical protein